MINKKSLKFFENTNTFKFITGASGDIGIDLTEELLKKEQNIIFHYNTNNTRFSELSKKYKSERSVCHKCDFSDTKSTMDLTKRISKKNISSWFHLVSPPIISEPILNIKRDSFLDNFNLQVLSVTTLMYSVVQGMVSRQNGLVLLMLSTAMIRNVQLWSSYVVSKYALLGLLQSLARDLSGTGVRVVGLMPSAAETKLAKESGVENANMMPVSRITSILIDIDTRKDYYPTGSLVLLENDGVAKVGNLNFQITKTL